MPERKPNICKRLEGVCAEQGVRLPPMVVECTGAWDKDAAKVLWEIARKVAAREGADGQALHGELLQELGVTARRFRARAVLRRRAERGWLAGAPSINSRSLTMPVSSRYSLPCTTPR